MRLVDQRNDRACALRLRTAAAKRAARIKVAREHAAGAAFRRKLASKVDHPLHKVGAALRVREGNKLLAHAGYAQIFQET